MSYPYNGFDFSQRGTSIGVGELQGQPAVRHLYGASEDILRRHAESHFLLVSLRVDPVEPEARRGCHLRLHPRHHSRRYSLAVRRCNPVGGNWGLRGREGRPEARHHTHLNPYRRNTEEATVARQPFDETGNVVPAASSGKGCIPSDPQRARS